MVNFPRWHRRGKDLPSYSDEESEKPREGRPKWSLGILNDKETDEVPGSVLLLSKEHDHNKPLGLHHMPARGSSSSLPQMVQSPTVKRTSSKPPKKQPKKTADGEIILNPQPDDSPNDPLNWPARRRDVALLSLGIYCMVGGGITPLLAAGFNDVAKTYNVPLGRVALTTGLYMMGLGVGGVLMSPTAILYGKRPVYLVTAVIFILSAVWCALSPNFTSLIVARIVQGIAVSPVEVLPSASVAEIFFLHERAFRLGIYTLLLLGGKNLSPLASAAVIQRLSWRWVFWVVAMIVGFCLALLFLFVPETFWERAPEPKNTKNNPNPHPPLPRGSELPLVNNAASQDVSAENTAPHTEATEETEKAVASEDNEQRGRATDRERPTELKVDTNQADSNAEGEVKSIDFASGHTTTTAAGLDLEAAQPEHHGRRSRSSSREDVPYTDWYRAAPPKSFVETLNPWNGRLCFDNWFRVAARPLVLFAYPAILWSALVYSLSIGWLIVLSESVAVIYRNKESYNFDALQTGLVYISPFIGAILGTAIAGKGSDYFVRFMSRRNGGIYEPEFRLMMGIPIIFTTTIGLMGFGWAAQERDNYMVPTLFFGIISFGCSLGSTTSITFAVDSYRQYAGEALVTLNFSKNIFHGLVFSFFVTDWLESDGAKEVFLAIGGINLALLLTTIPLYIYGKRARMWTVRKNMMERL